MAVISIKTETREGVLRIELSDGSVFSFNPCYLPDGVEINAAKEEDLRFASACLRAEKTALQLIARAEQTVSGLSRKLHKRGHDSACVRAVTQRLAELGLLDNYRYARLWLESKISRQGTSPRRLLAALCAKGIDLDDAERVLKETLNGETELRLLERYAQKQRRLGKLDPVDGESSASECRELKYMLKNEGFSKITIEIFLEEDSLLIHHF